MTPHSDSVAPLLWAGTDLLHDPGAQPAAVVVAIEQVGSGHGSAPYARLDPVRKPTL
jgi:hypothetical protein